MNKKFFVTQNGIQAGPLSLTEIAAALDAKTQLWADYIYDDQSMEWIMLMEFKPLLAHVNNANRPQAPEANTKSKNEQAWYILRGEEQSGPFTTLEMVKMLQEKKLFEYDFVWSTHQNQWLRLSSCEDFKPERIRTMFESDKTGKSVDVFLRRRHPRANCETSVIVHNNKYVWKGSGIEISQGGAGVIIETEALEVGQSLFLHFKPSPQIPAFNAVSLVVSRSKMSDQLLKYGLRFTSINQSIQLALKNFAEVGSKAA